MAWAKVREGVGEESGKERERERGLQQRTKYTIHTDWFHLIIENIATAYRNIVRTHTSVACVVDDR